MAASAAFLAFPFAANANFELWLWHCMLSVYCLPAFKENRGQAEWNYKH